MDWRFPELSLDSVELEVTQRDQFNNDEVALSETIVREAVQNSLDAASSEASQVRVSFRFMNHEDGIDGEYLKQLLKDQASHAQAAGLDLNDVNYHFPRALVIEDFGTTGLTGEIHAKDNGHFSDFWRRHGKSHKTGKSRGRWGLGKLVYSCSSMVGVFFGITRRSGDDANHLMGQTVLNLREVEGKTYQPHAFWCEYLSQDVRLPVPSRNSDFVNDFIDHFSLERNRGPGLSIVIPFPDKIFDHSQMVGIAIKNYFYPIITKKLILEIDETRINHDTIRDLAHEHASNHFDQIDMLFDFIEEASSLEPQKLLKMKPSWANDNKLDENDFDQDVLEKIRESFISGDLVSLYLPLTLKEKSGDKRNTSFSVFIKKPEEMGRGSDIYVRGGLTLPGESKFGSRKALGLLVAEEEPVCAFLGDAENAAHTLWTSNTEKLRKNWQAGQKSVTMIKKALIQLYDLLAEVTEETDEDALSTFFSFEEPEAQKNKKKRKTKPPEVPQLPRPPSKFTIKKISGGFVIENTDALSESELPKSIKIQLAYDVGRGNPFKKWSPHDFDLAKGDIKKSLNGATINAKSGQTLELSVNSLPFHISVSGFDENRDLKVKVR
ncbi:hypothetical protein [Alcanivorax sp.]|uniref:hypothetical protein n=1 Tax=Alcanivorax sp. TaxID=1872427 RepID=UPI003A8E1671